MIVVQVLIVVLWAAVTTVSSTISLASTAILGSTLNISTTSNNLTSVSAPNPSNPKRFIDNVYAEVLHMSILYPTASFIQAQLTSTIGPTADPSKLTDVRLIFKMHGEDAFYILIVQSKPYGGWESPRIIRQDPPPDDGVLPSRLGMDILLADLLMKDDGYGQEYEAVDVRWPINYPIARQQVYYFFHMVGNYPSLVAVGAKTHEVIAQYSGEENLFGTNSTETQ